MTYLLINNQVLIKAFHIKVNIIYALFLYFFQLFLNQKAIFTDFHVLFKDFHVLFGNYHVPFSCLLLIVIRAFNVNFKLKGAFIFMLRHLKLIFPSNVPYFEIFY